MFQRLCELLSLMYEVLIARGSGLVVTKNTIINAKTMLLKTMKYA
jgi:hypothetical protein